MGMGSGMGVPQARSVVGRDEIVCCRLKKVGVAAAAVMLASGSHHTLGPGAEEWVTGQARTRLLLPRPAGLRILPVPYAAGDQSAHAPSICADSPGGSCSRGEGAWVGASIAVQEPGVRRTRRISAVSREGAGGQREVALVVAAAGAAGADSLLIAWSVCRSRRAPLSRGGVACDESKNL